MKKQIIAGLLTLAGSFVAVPVEAQSDLVVTKTAPSVVTAGENLTYTITVTNNGSSRANDMVLSDPLPANTTFVSAVHKAGSTGFHFVRNFPPVGQSGTVSFRNALWEPSLIRLDPIFAPWNTPLFNAGGTLYFSCPGVTTNSDGVSAEGYELWKSDGTPEGTTLVKDIRPGTSTSKPNNFTYVGGTLYFTANDGTNGMELWKSDGTEAGTVLVKDINPSGDSNAGAFTNMNGTLFFVANSNGDNYGEVWKSDGTEAGTVLVKELPGYSFGSGGLTKVGNTLFFGASNPDLGRELWKSDGTPEGTALVKDLGPDTYGSSPTNLTDVNGTLFFTFNRKLWKSDGTPEGTIPLTHPSIYFSSAPDNFTSVGNTLFFSAGNSAYGTELWKSDGTPEGTGLVKDISPGSSSSNPITFIALNGTLFFRTDVDDDGGDLWRSDGTEEGTILVKDLVLGYYSGRGIGKVGNTLFFGSFDPTHGLELWKSDGTPEGTVFVKDINPGTSNTGSYQNSSYPTNFTDVNGTLYFRADSGRNGYILWKSDGTTEGTVPVRAKGPNSWATFEITVKVNNAATGTISNTASVTTSSTESDTSNNSATAITNVITLPRLNISNAPTLNEGNDGTLDATFTVTLSEVSSQTVTVNAITYNGTAKAPGDYTSSGTTMTFAPGETVKTFSVSVKGDRLDEPNEVFYLILSSAANAVIRNGRGIATIQDDDAPPSITIEDVAIGEGNAGVRTAVFRLHLSAPSGWPVYVNYASANGLSNPATPGKDYNAVASTQIAFTVGQTVTLARVVINGDALNELNETFLVNLSNPLNATVTDGQAIGTILNDDSPPALTISDAGISEGQSGTRQLTFTVTLSKASGQTVTVNYASADGIARSTSDYLANSGTLTFAPGSALTRTVTITISGDTQVEGDETLYVLLSGAVNASIGRGRGVGTITNDDLSG
jgi:uncharacterized repeat protein (TIGR01451 family)